MAQRETYGHMDFQWDNGPAVDTTSPFTQIKRQNTARTYMRNPKKLTVLLT